MKEMIIYVESETPQEEQKYRGWFWVKETKTFMRWNEFIEHTDC
jgi:hypothetical protein